MIEIESSGSEETKLVSRNLFKKKLIKKIK